MATMNPIDFLILDEHTAALDPKTAEIVMELTARVVREKHLTTLMVTHNLRHAVEYGDRTTTMHQGHIVLDRKGAEKARYARRGRAGNWSGRNQRAHGMQRFELYVRSFTSAAINRRGGDFATLPCPVPGGWLDICVRVGYN